MHCVLCQPDDFISLIGHGALETLQEVPQYLEGCLLTYCTVMGNLPAPEPWDPWIPL